MELTKDSTVSELIELFNDGEIKYKDVQDEFNCGRDLIQSRLKNIGLQWDNTAKKMIGEATAEDLNVQLATLFEKRRGKQSPKVNKTVTQLPNETDNKQTNKETNNPVNKQSDKPVRKKVTYEIDEWLHDEIRIRAIREKRNVSDIVNEILKGGLS